ncbi:MAG: sensor histidine kinase [Nakamurella sp.]
MSQRSAPVGSAARPGRPDAWPVADGGIETPGAHTEVMGATGTYPTSTPQPLRRALDFLAVTMLLIGGVELAFVLAGGPAADQFTPVLYIMVGWVWVAAGLLAWSRRPSNSFGFLVAAGGLTVLTSALDVTGVPVLTAAAAVVATVPLAVLVHVLHAFPSGRLPSRASRLTVLAGYAVSLVLQVPLYLFTAAPPPDDLLVVADRLDLVSLGHWVQSGVGSTVMLATIVILVLRLRRAEPRRRRLLAPLYGYGILAVLFIPLHDVLEAWLGASPDAVSALQLIAMAGVPVAFTVALLLGGFARTGEIQELSAWLSSAEAGRSPVAAAVARALGDDSTRLIFWMPDQGTYVHANGDHAELQTGNPGRGRAEVEVAGNRVGAIDYDTTLNPDPALVRAAGRVIAIAVDNDRVTAELRASQLALRRSRARIVEAGDAERRRITRDLHDGLQVRLVLLAMQAQQVAKDPQTSKDMHDAAVELRVGIDAAAAELRDLVHAVLPAALIERGLCAATEDLVDHLPIPTRLDISISEHSLPPVVESTAYFVIAEALTNALKHARPTALTVRVARIGDQLRIEVDDDGIGGAHYDGGTGLRGLTDRVDTLSGRLEVHSPPGRGTRIIAELPCAS